MYALNEAAHQQTTLLVTHLLEETRDYDEVWVMDKGLIIEQGSYVCSATATGCICTAAVTPDGDSSNHACFTAVLALCRRHWFY